MVHNSLRMALVISHFIAFLYFWAGLCRYFETLMGLQHTWVLYELDEQTLTVDIYNCDHELHIYRTVSEDTIGAYDQPHAAKHNYMRSSSDVCADAAGAAAVEATTEALASCTDSTCRQAPQAGLLSPFCAIWLAADGCYMDAHQRRADIKL
jgi:hypothetical protein